MLRRLKAVDVARAESVQLCGQSSLKGTKSMLFVLGNQYLSLTEAARAHPVSGNACLADSAASVVETSCGVPAPTPSAASPRASSTTTSSSSSTALRMMRVSIVKPRVDINELLQLISNSNSSTTITDTSATGEGSNEGLNRALSAEELDLEVNALMSSDGGSVGVDEILELAVEPEMDETSQKESPRLNAQALDQVEKEMAEVSVLPRNEKKSPVSSSQKATKKKAKGEAVTTEADGDEKQISNKEASKDSQKKAMKSKAAPAASAKPIQRTPPAASKPQNRPKVPKAEDSVAVEEDEDPSAWVTASSKKRPIKTTAPQPSQQSQQTQPQARPTSHKGAPLSKNLPSKPPPTAAPKNSATAASKQVVVAALPHSLESTLKANLTRPLQPPQKIGMASSANATVTAAAWAQRALAQSPSLSSAPAQPQTSSPSLSASSQGLSTTIQHTSASSSISASSAIVARESPTAVQPSTNFTKPQEGSSSLNEDDDDGSDCHVVIRAILNPLNPRAKPFVPFATAAADFSVDYADDLTCSSYTVLPEYTNTTVQLHYPVGPPTRISRKEEVGCWDDAEPRQSPMLLEEENLHPALMLDAPTVASQQLSYLETNDPAYTSSTTTACTRSPYISTTPAPTFCPPSHVATYCPPDYAYPYSSTYSYSSATSASTAAHPSYSMVHDPYTVTGFHYEDGSHQHIYPNNDNSSSATTFTHSPYSTANESVAA